MLGRDLSRVADPIVAEKRQYIDKELNLPEKNPTPGWRRVLIDT
ncbi:MAG: hypothetical protein WBS20_13670 [Lysobacterales bacterium]